MTKAMLMLYTLTTAMMNVGVRAMHLPHTHTHNLAVADTSWSSVPDVNVTFSYMFCCNETSQMDNVLTSIQALRFCFTDVMLFLDVPHGGFKKGEHFSGGPGGYADFINSAWGTQMISRAKKTAQAAVRLLQSRCSLSLHRSPTWKVDVLNYDEPDMRMTLESDFGVIEDSFPFSRMYPNTMVYDRLWHLPDTTHYVWHCDADVRILRIAEGASPNFVEASIRLLRSNSRVLMTAPTKARWFRAPEVRERDALNGTVNLSMCLNYEEGLWGGKEFDAQWPEGEALSSTYLMGGRGFSQWVSAEVFIMDVQRAKNILPFTPRWELRDYQYQEPMERLLTLIFQVENFFQVSLDCSSNIIAGYQAEGVLLPSARQG